MSLLEVHRDVNRFIGPCFCIAVAVMSAAIADPLVEGASRAGWFGPGTFDDGSMLDVAPVLLTGCALGVLVLAARVWGLLAGQQHLQRLLRSSHEALERRVLALLPVAFAIQILVLFSMETSEQYIVWGHVLGGTIWLGGPILVSLAAHALVCLVVAFVALRAVRSLAGAAVRVITLIRALGTLSISATSPTVPRRRNAFTFHRIALALSIAGERAPPLRLA